MRTGKLAATGVMVLVAATMLAACSSSSKTSTTSSSTPPAANESPSTATSSSAVATSPSTGASQASAPSTYTPPTPVPVKIALIGPPPLNESLWADVATAQGYFKDVGLTPSFTYFGHGTDVAKSVLSKSVDVGLDTTPSNIELVAQGSAIVALAGMDSQDWVVGVSDPSVTTCAALKGLTIGDDGPNNARRLFLGQALQSCGLTLDDTKHVAIGSTPSDIVKAAVAGQVKAAVLHAPELAQVAASAKATWHAVTFPDVLKQGHYSMFSVLKSYLATPTGNTTATRTIAAYILARAWIANPANAEAFAELTGKAEGEDTATALAGNKLLAAVPFWVPGSTGLTQANIEGEIKLLVAQGSVKANQAPTYNDLVDLSVYPKALAIAQQIVPGVQ